MSILCVFVWWQIHRLFAGPACRSSGAGVTLALLLQQRCQPGHLQLHERYQMPSLSFHFILFHSFIHSFAWITPAAKEPRDVLLYFTRITYLTGLDVSNKTMFFLIETNLGVHNQPPILPSLCKLTNATKQRIKPIDVMTQTWRVHELSVFIITVYYASTDIRITTRHTEKIQ